MQKMTFPLMMGLSGFPYFFGVIEDNVDPDKMGRVRVRILGLHSEELVANPSTGKGIPTEDLPWAWVMKPCGSSSMDGLGWSSVGMKKGTWVFGFSRDGDFYNDLVIMGSVGGMPDKGPNANKGFSDPDEVYPEILDEPDINRLARNEKISETIVQDKKDDRKIIVPQLPVPWFQPLIPYAAEYPFNEVYESGSGHVFEIDDTEGEERLHKYHKSGTFEEIDKDGNMVTKVQGDNYTIVIGDNYCNIEGINNVCFEDNVNVTMLGSINTIISTGTVELTAPNIKLNGYVLINDMIPVTIPV